MALIMLNWKRQEKCGTILTKFKEEICRDPDVDVALYTQTLMDEFRKWNKARETSLIDVLFLSLYAQDVQSLRRDLCKFEPHNVLCKLKALDTASAKFPKRGLLLSCLYGELALYTGRYAGENFSSIIEMCDQGIEIDQKKYEEIEQKEFAIQLILSKFKEEICHNPNANSAPYVNMLIGAYSVMETECIEKVINTLFLNLYAQDADSLRRDICKCKLMLCSSGPLKAMPSQRTELLSCFYGALSSYIGEDFSSILAMCDR